MWTIDVRMQGDLAWLLIWTGGGGLAERDARRRYEQVRDRINGRIQGPDNVHAERWETARLVFDGIAQEEHRAGADDAQRGMPTLPPRAR